MRQERFAFACGAVLVWGLGTAAALAETGSPMAGSGGAIPARPAAVETLPDRIPPPAMQPPVMHGNGTGHPGPDTGAGVAFRELGPDDHVGQTLAQMLQAKEAGRIFEDKREQAAAAAFYAGRAYRLTWIKDGRLNDKARAVIARLKRADEDGLDPAAYPAPAPGKAATPEELAAAELRLTASVLGYARHAQGGRVDPQRLGPMITVTPPRPDPLDVLVKIADAKDPAATLDGFNPPHEGFQALRRALAAVRAKSATQPARIPDGKRLVRGMRDPRVAMLRERLGLAPGPTPELFDDTVLQAVLDFQRRQGLAANGAVTPGTLKALNGGASVRVSDILINMERWRWLPRDLGKRHVIVNIPEFLVRIVDQGGVVYEGRVVVGKPTSPTPIFSDRMEHVIVNPYWNVPASIAVEEMRPKLMTDPGYFARRGFELVGANGKVVSPYRVSLRQIESGRFRFRQPPGEANALGRIKFMFPNEHDVYM
ncbi:MAG: L,D-transpeptidase family protein, partial [Pseudomonadota bacterium]|nr:L,D-transpeptidase family protein [Pseudomonadota bacterium]